VKSIAVVVIVNVGITCQYAVCGFMYVEWLDVFVYRYTYTYYTRNHCNVISQDSWVSLAVGHVMSSMKTLKIAETVFFIY